MPADFIYFKLPQKKTIYGSETEFSKTPECIDNIKNPAFVFGQFNDGNNAYVARFLNVYKVNPKYTPKQEFFLSNAPIVKSAKYTTIVNNAIALLNSKNSKLKKVVLARTTFEKLANKSIFDAFKQICTTYHKHFCYLISSKTLGTWVGASPEPILNLIHSKNALTVALAGTKASKTQQWTGKEKEEQMWVQQHILQLLKQQKLTFIKSKNQTVASGNLFHLQTKFNIETPTSNSFFRLLKLLNPTPAVAGYPVGLSIKYIKENEQLNRSFYTGLVGVINFNNKHYLYVNLRCAQIHNDKIQLFAGAGITKDSKSELEFLETERKMQAIGHFFT